jgi:hypothetical protein
MDQKWHILKQRAETELVDEAWFVSFPCFFSMLVMVVVVEGVVTELFVFFVVWGSMD